MITQNYKQFLAMMLQSSSSVSTSGIRLQDVYGYMRYASGAVQGTSYRGFPSESTDTYTLNRFAAGVSIGRGSTEATEYDWNLEDTVTSGVLIQKISHVPGMDSDGCPYLRYTFTITNTDTDTLVIREVGYKQMVKCCNTPGRNDDSRNIFLFDRTLLDSPLVIEPGDAGVLVYTLKTIPRQARTVGGVKVVGFDWGTDTEIGAILDAAKNGSVDLQEDIGWRVGDTRKIHLDPFTDGEDRTHAAQDIDIVITSFDSYDGQNNIIQFDFLECLAISMRMCETQDYRNGYGASEMYTETLPAIVAALPGWLRGRLMTFDVVTAKEPGSIETETITGNKLALRSEMEVFGVLVNASAVEGTQVEWYKRYDAHRKRAGYNGSYSTYFLRSPYNKNLESNPNVYYGYASCADDYSIDDSGQRSRFTKGTVNSRYYIAPFGCI